MWLKDEWIGHPMRPGSIVVIYKAVCFDVAQGQMNWAPNETRASYRNLQSSLLRCGTRPKELGTQWEKSLLQ